MRSRTAPKRNWKIAITHRSRKLRISPHAVRKLLRSVLESVDHEIKIPSVSEVHLLITGDDEIRVMNREFRKKDKATDVLSFPQYEPEQVRGKKRVPDPFQQSLGDLVVSTETTIRQAREFGVSPREELTRLLVHGILHLCGYDHEKVPRSEAQRMRRREKEILKCITLPER